MLKVIVTGNFAGSIELAYGDNEIGGRPLMSVAFVGTALTDGNVRGFLGMVPVRYGSTWAQDWGTDKLKFSVMESEVTFEEFWNAYGNKVNPIRCKPVFAKLSTADKTMAIKCISAYNRYLARNTWRNKADPETWLKKKMWETGWDNL